MKIKFEGGHLDGQERDFWRPDPMVEYVVVPPTPLDAEPSDTVQLIVEWYKLVKYSAGGFPTRWVEARGPHTTYMVEVPNPNYQEEWRYVLVG